MDTELLDLMACPACKKKLRLESDLLVCTNTACGLRYPVRDGIPVLVIEEARKSRD